MQVQEFYNEKMKDIELKNGMGYRTKWLLKDWVIVRCKITREIYQHVLPDMDRQVSIVIEGAFAKRIEESMKTEPG